MAITFNAVDASEHELGVYLGSLNNSSNDDGTFETNKRTLESDTPNGSWYLEEIRVEDDAGNTFREYYRGATDSTPLKGTITNDLYLGNDDTTIASLSDLAIKVADGEISITGKLMDDGAALTVGQVNVEIMHSETGITKWFSAYTEDINADGTFETRSNDLRSSDPSGTWVLKYSYVKDDAGNEVSERYVRGDDNNPLKATVTNDLYLGGADNTSATASNITAVMTTNYEGKVAIQFTGLVTDDAAPLTSGEVNIRATHTKSGEHMWLNANENQINSDGIFETYIRTLESSDPSGTWYISELRIKDDAGNQSFKEWKAQDSSPYKFSLTNNAYTGSQSGDATGSDFEAPAYANLLLTVVADGDGTSTLKLTGTLADPSGMDYMYLRFKNADDASAPGFSLWINDGEIDGNGLQYC